MKILKFNEAFKENLIKVGDILKRISIDDKHYDLYLVTDRSDNSKDIKIYQFAITSLNFDTIRLYPSKSPYNMNRFFINRYSLLTDEEIKLLINKINSVYDHNYDDYFDKIYQLTKIDLKSYALNKSANKYNL
jgi:hypothetical protein